MSISKKGSRLAPLFFWQFLMGGFNCELNNPKAAFHCFVRFLLLHILRECELIIGEQEDSYV